MSYNNQIDFTGSTQSDLDCENAQLVSNCCKAYPRVEVDGTEWNDEETGICSDCGERCEYVEVEVMNKQILYEGAVTVADIENMAEIIADSFYPYAQVRHDWAKLEANRQLTEWFNTASEDHTAGMPEYENYRY